MSKTRKIEESFFQLLQIAVGKTLFDTIDLSDEEWRAIYELATKQSLVSVILHAIDTIENDDSRPPKPLLLQWIGESELIRHRNNRVNLLCEQLSSWFKTKGYTSCILKGQGVARLYNLPDSRQAGDIDIWVKAQRDEVVRLMRKDCIGVTYVDYVNCHAAFFTDAEVEVHFRPTWMFNPFVNRRVQQWIKDNQVSQFDNFDEKVGFSYPTIGFNLVFSLVHIYRHVFFEGIGLRQLMDYYYILSHSTQTERDIAFDTLKSFGMAKFAGAAMYVMKRVFNMDKTLLLCDPNDENGDFLLSEIIRGGNFGKYDDRNVHVDENKKIKRGLSNLKRDFRFLEAYPSEVIWMPVWKVWHWCWRKFNGYL